MRGEGPSAGRVLAVLAASLVAAVGLGVAARAAAGAGLIAYAGPIAAPVDRLGRGAIALGAPWLAVAWLLGAFARRPALGAVAGALALAGGTGAWYAFTVWQVGRAALGYAVPVALGWSAAAVAAGAVFGIAGALWRSAPSTLAHALGAAVLAGSFLGEAILLATIWDGRAARAVLAGELALGLALAVALLIGRPRSFVLGLGLTALVTLAAAGAEQWVRDALRGVGWGGL
ncbi:MAG: hypothetical protein IRZ32_09865 [Solirubrobacteraceae bacterium]|nr:hypothetical protein [Solirubrobacteraceae bacterium]